MRRTLTVFLLLLIAAGAAAGERYPYGRWIVGLDSVHSDIGGNDQQNDVRVEEQASGGALQIGYMLRPSLQVRIYSAAADHSTDIEGTELRYSGASLDVAYLFNPGGAFRPYLSGGGGGFVVESQQGALTFESEGPGVAIGAGFHLHVNRHLGLHAQARLESVNWNLTRATLQLPGGGTSVVETPVDESGSLVRLSVGGAFWF